MTDKSERKRKMNDDLLKLLDMSARIWRENSEAKGCPTFSRGDCREWPGRYEKAAARICELEAALATGTGWNISTEKIEKLREWEAYIGPTIWRQDWTTKWPGLKLEGSEE